MQMRAIIVTLVAVAAAAVAAGCGGSKTLSMADYHTSVVRVRDRTDYALAQVTQQKTKAAFLDQMEASADLIDDAANDFSDDGSAKGFRDESKQLTKQLHQLAADLRGTSQQVQIPGYEDLLNAKGLSFQSWVNINAILASLSKQGVAVDPLGRH
jgi:hypothetical protein